MQLDERLEKEKRRRREQRQRNAEDEETMDYLNRMRRMALNETEGVFTSPLEKGINSDRSIFDKQALFFRGVHDF